MSLDLPVLIVAGVRTGWSGARAQTTGGGAHLERRRRRRSRRRRRRRKRGLYDGGQGGEMVIVERGEGMRGGG